MVGIGASAGGLEAFTRLLRHLRPDSGCAIVLVQHLAASHASALTELLSRETSLPVTEVVDGTTACANHVYVIPPNAQLTIVGGVLHLAPRPPSRPHLAVDRFLESLATDCGSRAVGVILSGNGSDGTAGLRAIRARGGLTFAQDPATAESPGMPSQAAAGGGAAVVLSPEEIGAALSGVADDPDLGRDGDSPAVAVAVSGAHLSAICDVMRSETGIDFSLYRATTVSRRILRRLAARNLSDPDSYVELLASDGDERTELKRELLIGVTSFFRDPECFSALSTNVLPALVRARPPGSPIRIWVAGCATGEEAYSIAMVLKEYQAANRLAFPVQLFASDLSDAAIDGARNGRYSEATMEPVSPARRRRHFTPVAGGFQINKELRDQCVFSRHNLLDDPPFSRLDLVSCRNVLIYLDAAQRRVIPLFHYALRDGGFLLLGRSEAPNRPDLFEQVDPGQRIYSKRAVPSRPQRSVAPIAGSRRAADALAPAFSAPGGSHDVDMGREADRLLATRFSPTAVLVDDALRVLEVRGPSVPFLALTAGTASLHLASCLPDAGLFLEVERLIREAASTGEVSRATRMTGHDRAHRLRLEVAPMRHHGRTAFLVLFVTAGAAAAGHGVDDAASLGGPTAATDGHAGDVAAGETATLADLRDDVQRLRSRLVTLMDEQDARHDGTQRVVDDALSANEELQSLTEELETAKEELQASNEELLTLNRELEERNRALVEARDLAKAIVATVGVPLLVVDTALTVWHANRAFTQVFQVPPPGLDGQQLYELSGGAWNVAALRTRIDALVADRQAFERLEVTCELPIVGARILQISGCGLDGHLLLLLTIDDVTAHRSAEVALQRSEDLRRQGEKMEVVGRLAGGVAHDFNNLLTVILANVHFLSESVKADSAAREQASDIRKAAERAAALTDQLLSFSRLKVLQPKTFDLNVLLHDFERMLRRLLPESIRTVIRTAAVPCVVKADPAEIGRVVMNLAVNARDAMPAGGTLTWETSHVGPERLDGSLPSNAGPSVRLVVTDTGIGMSSETRDHAFEPFFTTKDLSRGAGLGLSTVLGILEQSGGTISCESELGRGTRFTIVLPAEPEAADVDADPGEVQPAARHHGETILVVEDDDVVRGLATRILDHAGYVVLSASGGEAALAVLRSQNDRVGLLVTDVLMPDMGGGELAHHVRSTYPDLKVLFVSGHADDVLAREGVERGAAFLQKPYGPTQLTRKVRDVLDAPAGQSGP